MNNCEVRFSVIVVIPVGFYKNCEGRGPELSPLLYVEGLDATPCNVEFNTLIRLLE